MSKVLIADHSKPSLVMTSEIFKDSLPGVSVVVAHTGRECVELVGEHKPDLVLVDFDLPDVDGATLTKALRKIYDGPVLVQAFEDSVVEEALEAHHFASNDAGTVISKPVKSDTLKEKIKMFLVDDHRLDKRFDTDLEMQIVAKAAGRGKRAPKAEGVVTNISFGGIQVELGTSMKMKKDQEITVNVLIPLAHSKVAAPKKNAAKKKVTKKKGATKGTDTKIKAKVAWASKDGKSAGIRFTKLTEVQRVALEKYFRSMMP